MKNQWKESWLGNDGILEEKDQKDELDNELRKNEASSMIQGSVLFPAGKKIDAID